MTRHPSPRSRPRFLNSGRHLNRRSYRPKPDPRQTTPKGIVTLWTRVRRLIWSWWPWAMLAIYLIDKRQWWGAFGVALWAGVCSLSTPAEFPPQYGLDHDLEVGSADFVDTMAGATGVQFVAGNSITVLNNGDAFYPVMLREIELAEQSITVEAYIYWAGEVGLQFANALAAIESGATVLDAAVGGTGGCPFAPQAAKKVGNIATEDLVYLLHGMGYETGAAG